MRALVVSNLRADAGAPGRGVFVRDQVAALRALDGVEVTHFEFPPGPRSLARAALTLRRRYRRDHFDVVHAHFGLSAWTSLAVPARARVLTVHGTDVRHPRTGHLTAAVLPRMTLVAAVSASLLGELPAGGPRGQRAVLPCGVDLDRFQPQPRAQARTALGLDPSGPYLLFPADPRRVGKRHDRALELAGDTPLLTLGAVPPRDVPRWINAANAVVVPSEAEGFGLAVLEALACDVPVLATDVGIHALALRDVAGTLCAPYERNGWRAALAPHLAAADPRIAGRGRAELFSARRMAERVLIAWRSLLPDAAH